jgi:hypothetical protein
MREPTSNELDAITEIFRAYMACNACPDTLEWERSPEYGDNPTAMGYLAAAGRAAWAEVAGNGAGQLWSDMIECGEDARHVWKLYLAEQ